LEGLYLLTGSPFLKSEDTTWPHSADSSGTGWDSPEKPSEKSRQDLLASCRGKTS